MSDSTPRLKLDELVDGQELDAMTINDALVQLDALTDLYLKGQFVNTPPASPIDGDTYLLGAAPTGPWTGRAYKIAACIDGLWRFLTPFDGLRAFVATTNAFIIYQAGSWIDANALISAHEVSIASAATCDLGAAGSLFVAITGTTAITALGTAVNLLRFVRFAGALTLTHNATSLVLPGAANIATAAGDTAVFSCDGSGNWRCRGFTRASGVPLNVTAVTGSGNLVLSSNPSLAAPSITGSSTVNANPTGASGITRAFGLSSGGSVGGDGAAIDFGSSSLGQTTFRISSPITGSQTGALILAPGSGVNNVFTEAARFASDGSFLIATTATGGWSGASRLEAKAGTAANAVSGYCAGSSGAAFLGRVDNSAASLAGFYYGAAAVGSITTTGTVTAYNTTSDARLKTVTQQRDWRDAIGALWVGDFVWNDTGAPGFGVLAQQAYDVMPGHAGVTRPAGDGVWQASAEPFAFLALWGVKDLYAAVAALSARVAALEAAHAG